MLIQPISIAPLMNRSALAETNSQTGCLEHRLQEVRNRIRLSCEEYGRAPQSVRLVAVGKKHPVQSVATLASLGQQDFAENYLQEASEKMDWYREQTALSQSDLVWHFIGQIQSRKCRSIAERFDWVHTVDSLMVAMRLNQYTTNGRLNVLIQVNIDNEPTKAGIRVDALAELAGEISQLPNLRLRGLMIIPRFQDSFERQRATFARCRELQASLVQDGLDLDQLSMGMTADMEAAIAEGATLIRIGTALFGPRPTS